MMTYRVGVGLSGGTDSALAAKLLLEAGHDVIGFTMQLLPGCGATAAKGAAVAARLGIPHRVLDMTDRFEELVLTPFADAYRRGLTPSPCVCCNAQMKFGAMLDAMLAAGCERVATGHYARLVPAGDDTLLLRGRDPRKDQSYFLAMLNADQRRRAIFPLGDRLKKDVQARAAALELVAPSEGESQDLCFLPDGDFASFVAARYPELSREGWIVTSDGTRLGRHRGAYQYTRGQRRGLGLGGGPWFVLRIDIADNLVVVGRQDELLSRNVILQDVNWLLPPPAAGAELPVQAQVRYLMQARPATLRRLDDSRAEIVFADPVSAVTPGQLAAAYLDDRVVAGGWIS